MKWRLLYDLSQKVITDRRWQKGGFAGPSRDILRNLAQWQKSNREEGERGGATHQKNRAMMRKMP